MEMRMELSEKIQQLRKGKGWTQEELAEALYVSRTAVSKWESGRGYPNLESLKAISRLFSVSIDDLLSGEALMTLAEHESLEKARGLRDTAFGILDLLAAALFFLPLFAQRGGTTILSVPLYVLADTPRFLLAAYFVTLSLTVLWGVAALALQACRPRLRQRGGLFVSLLLSAFATLLFIASAQPYPATLVFFMLLMKGFLLLKQR